MESLIESGRWLPFVFAFVMALSILIYAVLDGYDVGIGILTNKTKSMHDKDVMISAIGPFWDANETWMVLAVGILLFVFPGAQGLILTELYIPVFIMLIGIVFRGASFDFRAKVDPTKKWLWDKFFSYSSSFIALSQGYMLGIYIMGFDNSLQSIIFALLIALMVHFAYCLVGATWLIIKCDKKLQKQAIIWAKYYLINTLAMVLIIHLAFYANNLTVFNSFLVMAMVLISILLFFLLTRMPFDGDKYSSIPFFITILNYLLFFYALFYNLYPYIIPGKMTIFESAGGRDSLMIILVFVLFALPVLITYTTFVYYVFRGKTKELTYN